MLAAAAVAALADSPALAQADVTEKPANSIQSQYGASNDPSRFDLDHDGELRGCKSFGRCGPISA